jgi:hypothetical protein
MAEADNPFFQRRQEGPRRPAYGTAEYLANANMLCSRQELEWFYDTAGNMRLKYQGRA